MSMHPFQRRRLTWSAALAAFAEADLLRRRAFSPRIADAQGPAWEPPVDVLETDDEILILTAMPGVDPGAVDVTIEGCELTISGRREMPGELARALIHRLELPQGCFARRIALPPGRYASARRASVNNCLIIRLSKAI
jgi:HSP20 family molecular chaperone IbpA